MAQKSITSFFTKSPAAKKETNSETIDDDESIKIPTNKKLKRRRISSSDEEQNLDILKKTVVSPEKKEKSPKKLPENNKSKIPNVESIKNNTTEDLRKKLLNKSSSDTNDDSENNIKPSKKKKKSSPKSKKILADKKNNETLKDEDSLKVENILKAEDSLKVQDSLKAENKTPVKEPVQIFKKQLKLQTAGAGLQGDDYDPSALNYHPINDAFWKKGEKTPYLALTRTFQLIEEIRGRLKMIEVLSNFYRSVIVLNPIDLLPSVYLCLNQLAPSYEGLELGVAETYLMKAICQSTGRSMAQIKNDIKSTGDLGIVAENSRSNQKMMFTPAPLTVEGVFTKIKDIAKMSGNTSMNKKVDKIQSIFVACRHSEARYFIRSLSGKLRIGLAEQSVLQALAVAITNTPPNQDKSPMKLNIAKKLGETGFKAAVDENSLILKTAYCQCPNYDKIIPVLLENGISELLKHCPMEPGSPLKPMLAHPSKGVQSIFERLEGYKFTCEWKYDGERAQIHCDKDGKISIYSRNQENNTTKFPDIISRINNVNKDNATTYIMDTEIVAWDVERKQILPFQVLSTRKRKDADETQIKVQVCVYMFDLLYLNNKPLVTIPFIERRKLLHDTFQEIEGSWQFAKAVDTNDSDEVQAFLEESIKGNCEGLMVKTLEKEATYEIAKRSRNWLKLKKDYLSGAGDSLDLVVIGGYRGKGKRTGNYGGFLLACYDAENEEYQSICKIGTGFSDEDLQNHAEFFKPHIVPNVKSYYRYDSSHEPDDWFEPIMVWEVKCADLSLSPVHQASIGIVDSEKGVSLRFPRFIRIRDDKKPEDATSAHQVSEMYFSQDQIKNQQDGKAKDVEEDYY